MIDQLQADICVIGAGTAGLVTAAVAAQLGARTVLFERHKMGRECLNYGCVPSKALLAAAKAAKSIRNAGRFGVSAALPVIDFAAVMRHVHGAIGAIAPHDSIERLEGLGVKVVQAAACFTGPRRGRVLHRRDHLRERGAAEPRQLLNPPHMAARTETRHSRTPIRPGRPKPDRRRHVWQRRHPCRPGAAS